MKPGPGSSPTGPGLWADNNRLLQWDLRTHTHTVTQMDSFQKPTKQVLTTRLDNTLYAFFANFPDKHDHDVDSANQRLDWISVRWPSPQQAKLDQARRATVNTT